jgi:DNA-binding MarR family transcriptional regulator
MLMTTGSVESLEALGWTRRERHPLDASKTWMTLTDKARQELGEAACQNSGHTELLRVWHCPHANALFAEVR